MLFFKNYFNFELKTCKTVPLFWREPHLISDQSYPKWGQSDPANLDGLNFGKEQNNLFNWENSASPQVR